MTSPETPGPEFAWTRLEHQDRAKAEQGRRSGWFLLPGVVLVNAPIVLKQAVGIELPVAAVVGLSVVGMACLVAAGVLLWLGRRSRR